MEKPSFMLDLILTLQHEHEGNELDQYYSTIRAYEQWLFKDTEHDCLRAKYFQPDWIVAFLADVWMWSNKAFYSTKRALMEIWQLAYDHNLVPTAPSLHVVDIPEGTTALSVVEQLDLLHVQHKQLLAMN